MRTFTLAILSLCATASALPAVKVTTTTSPTPIATARTNAKSTTTTAQVPIASTSSKQFSLQVVPNPNYVADVFSANLKMGTKYTFLEGVAATNSASKKIKKRLLSYISPYFGSWGYWGASTTLPITYWGYPTTLSTTSTTTAATWPPTSWAALDNPNSLDASPDPRQIEYLCPISIGGQSLLVNLDTGSSDLWVFSNKLPTSLQSGRTIFNVLKSLTAQLLNGVSWNITYADDTFATGQVYKDTVKIGTYSIYGQAVEVATNAGGAFLKQTAASGIMGLAFASLNSIKPKQTALIDNLHTSLPYPVFTADLKDNDTGSYDFGYIDAAKHVSAIQYVPLVDYKNTGAPAFWQFAVSSYQVAKNSIVSDVTTAIADTGSTLIYVSEKMCADYYAKVTGAQLHSGGWFVPCNATMPDMSLSVGSHLVTIPGDYMNAGEISTTICAGGLQVTGDTFYVYGDIFFKAVFAVFDIGVQQFGFATKKLS